MIAVRARGLSKGYRQYRRPSDSLKEVLLRRSFHTMVWALRDLTFELTPGEHLGVIGDNGAGKSTLLKLLAGTVRPSAGEVAVTGRVAAILELGSGFHPEFSGIDNIRMGCALRGLSGAETEALIPEIVAFSELGGAVERPVKTYSSGMYVRLAFSVVTAVSPDVLIIDEALSVGDQHFQKKSLDRIRSLMTSGRTLVFCSHNLYQVKSLCRRALWLDGGGMRMLGPAEEVVDAYLDYSRTRDRAAEPAAAGEAAPATDGQEAWIEDAALIGDGGPADGFADGERLRIRVLAGSSRLRAGQLTLAVVLMRNDDIHVYGTSTEIEGVSLTELGSGRFGKTLVFDELALLSGQFRVYVYLLDESGIHIYDKREAILPFTVRHATREVGVARLAHRWEDP